MPEYKVLVPLDGSRLAEHSLVYLDALRSMGESRVLLLSVADEDEDVRSLSTGESGPRAENLLGTYLREVSSDIHQHLGIEVASKVAFGTAANCILDEAREFSPDLIIISTHGRSGISRWRLGSVADKVIRGAASNTLVVGPKAAERTEWIDARILEPFRSLLVPLDGSGRAEAALPVAKAFAESYGSVIHLVRVVSLPTAYGDPYVESPSWPVLMDSMVEGARESLSKAAGQIGLPDTKMDVLIGPPAIRLDEYVSTNGIDLVVMTSHGRSGFVRTALGSVTDRLLGGAAPVLVVRVHG